MNSTMSSYVILTSLSWCSPGSRPTATTTRPPGLSGKSFHVRLSSLMSRRANSWSTANDNITLGFFELDSRIYFDDARLFPVDKSLILDAMLLSLRLGSYLELSSSVFAEEPGLVNVHCRDGADRNIEIFEIRTLSNRVVVRELGRRWIEKRRCSGCSCWIPPTGPGLCLEHIFNWDLWNEGWGECIFLGIDSIIHLEHGRNSLGDG